MVAEVGRDDANGPRQRRLLATPLGTVALWTCSIGSLHA